MDRLESMSLLVSVVEAGTFSAAARRLGTPLATVSRKISMLEDHLGTLLLERAGRQLNLTDAGRSYVAACKSILEQLGEAERAAAGQFGAARGELVIAAPIVFGRLHVLPVVTAFLKKFPEIDVRLRLADGIANLFEHEAEVAVRIGELPDSSLLATRVGTVRRVACGSPTYFARHPAPKHPRELGEHECVTFEAVSSPELWVFREGKADVKVRVHSRLVVSTAEAAIDAAVAGVGITRVLSYQAAAAERARSLVRVLRSFEPPAAPVQLVHVGSRLLPQKVRAFLDFAAPRLKARLGDTS